MSVASALFVHEASELLAVANGLRVARGLYPLHFQRGPMWCFSRARHALICPSAERDRTSLSEEEL
jgi:hypothetical protein